MAGASGTKKQRKYGRNAISCARYASTNRREKNKLRRLAKHLIRFPADKVATSAVDRCNLVVRGF